MNNSTNQRQNQQEQQQNRLEQQQNHYYNNNYIHTDPGVSLPGAEIMDQIAEAYRDNISDRITAVAAGVIEEALKHGMEPATVILAIEETGMASRPSPYYLAAVLRNWATNGVVFSRARGTGEVFTTAARPWWRR